MSFVPRMGGVGVHENVGFRSNDSIVWCIVGSVLPLYIRKGVVTLYHSTDVLRFMEYSPVLESVNAHTV